MKNTVIKSILVLVFFSLCLSGCQKEEIPYFNSQHNAVRFNDTKEYDSKVGIYKGNYSFLENPFAEYAEYSLPLILIGNISTEDRIVKYTIDNEKSTAPSNSYEIVEALIPANSLEGSIKVKMYNTEEIQNGTSYSVYIRLDTSPALELGPQAFITASLSWNSDIIAPPATERYKWMTYNSLIKSSLAPTSNSSTAYSSNALKAIVTALNWNDWDDMTAHPELIQRPAYYNYKYLADYRLLMTEKTHEAFAAILGDYLKKYKKDHPDTPLIHNEGSLKGSIIEARAY